MLIDWFTVIAQIINFLILVYLLKRFLYKPILNAIDEREKRIASQLEDAAKQKAEANQEKEKYQEMNKDLSHKKDSLLKEAQSAAETERQSLLKKAKQEYTNLREKLKESFSDEQAKMKHDLKRRTQQEVFDIARKVLTDLADTSLESQVVEVFLKKLKGMKKEEMDTLLSRLKESNHLTVRSAFELSSDQQQAITQVLKKRIGPDTQLKFQTSAEEVGGIELYSGGYKLAWTISEYLNSLEKKIAEIANITPGRQPTPTNIRHEK
jgi:F-type H+-transporting ATPase subunit b